MYVRYATFSTCIRVNGPFYDILPKQPNLNTIHSVKFAPLHPCAQLNVMDTFSKFQIDLYDLYMYVIRSRTSGSVSGVS